MMAYRLDKKIEHLKTACAEHELAFTPWVLREARKSFHFLHKRGLLQPVQEDLKLKTKPKKHNNIWEYINHARAMFGSFT